jgi:hypothetical protein
VSPGKRKRTHARRCPGDPYAEGADAATAGQEKTINPYVRGSEDHTAWDDGWHDIKYDSSVA